MHPKEGGGAELKGCGGVRLRGKVFAPDELRLNSLTVKSLHIHDSGTFIKLPK